MAQRPIAYNVADPYHSGDERYPPKGALSKEAAHMNAHFPLLRIAFAATAALFIFLIVHAALEGISTSAGVLAGLR
jgi:hypothetical protein